MSLKSLWEIWRSLYKKGISSLFLTRFLDKKCSSFRRDFFPGLKIFSKLIATALQARKNFQSWKKRSSKEPISYPKIAFFLLLIGCTPSQPHQWEIQEIITTYPFFNGGRLLLSPDSSSSRLELEIIRNCSGIQFYVNLLFLYALPLQEDPTRTEMTILFENQDPWIVYPYLLEGKQRLLLPEEIASTLIQALLNQESFTIQLGRYEQLVIPTLFLENYQSLLKLPTKKKIPNHK